MDHKKAHQYFIWLYIKKLIIVRYRGACLGLMWNILQPFLYLLILGFVFATFNHASLEDYVIYLFAGLVPWRFFEQSVMSMMDSIILNSAFLKKIPMQAIYFPLIQLGIAFVDFLSAFSLLFLLLLLIKVGWHVEMLILPFSILLWSAIAAGFGSLAAILFVFFQDLKNIMQMILMLMLFTSTIFFKADLFAHDPFKMMILKYDPICYWVNLFQKPIYYGTWPGFTDWWVSLLSAGILLTGSMLLYAKMRRWFYYYL